MIFVIYFFVDVMKKKNTKKILYSLDTPVDVLHLSARPTNVLRDNNINTIGQLVHLIKTDKKSFLNLKNLGKTSADEISAALEGIEIIGYQQDSYSDIIDNYAFSKRALTVFETHNIKTISDLQKYSLTEIKRWKNIGKQTLDEIVDVLSNVDKNAQPEIIEKKSVYYYVFNDKKTFNPNNKSVYECNFSNRTLNVLRRRKIETLSELQKYSLVEIRGWRNIGKKCIDEITDVLSNFSMDIPKVDVNVCLCVSDDCFKFYTISPFLYEKLLTKDFENSSDLERFLISEKEFSLSNESFLDVVLFHKDFERTRCLTFCNAVTNDLNKFLEPQTLNVFNILLAFISACIIKKIPTDKIYNLDTDFCKTVCADIDVYLDTAKKTILKKLRNTAAPISMQDLSPLFPTIICNLQLINTALSELEKDRLIRKTRNGNYESLLSSVVEYIKNIKDEKIRDIITRKIVSGQTLGEIGRHYSITRERVRQIIKKSFLRKKDQSIFAEDKYAAIYQKYFFTRDNARIIFGDIATSYFQTRYESGKVDLEEALEDKTVSQSLRRKIQRKIVYTNYIYVGKQYVKKQRSSLYHYFIQRYCRKDTEIESFLEEYSNFWQKYGLEKELYEIDVRALQGHFLRMKDVLYKYPRTFRYYDFEQYDFTELLDTLNLKQYENVLLSTAKFTREYPKLMKKYDIHDEYELHNLLRMLLEDKDKNITFHRMPTIEFGKGSVDNQVIALLSENAPISPEQLATLYEERYGTQAATVRGSCFNCIQKYLHKSIYTIDLPPLSENEFDYLKQNLSKEFYTFTEVKQVFSQKFTDLSHINPMTLKELGFIVNEGYIIQRKFESAVNYFKYLLTKNEKIDYFDIQPAIRNNVTFNMV